MQNQLWARRGHNNNCRDRIAKALEEDDTGDGKDRSKLQKEKFDQYVAAEGGVLLIKDDAESGKEHGDSRQMDESNAQKGSVDKDMMDDSV